jgi:hypothetical protein
MKLRRNSLDRIKEFEKDLLKKWKLAIRFLAEIRETEDFTMLLKQSFRV